ncbi:uncharacterized protein B0H18DRAFT_1006114 [Fomitopsis serialis]|uniref:uncharacterized protein n=1 Tax=Fomitopsis serialis TaxID=139415 RepID=UPI00200763B3|nr:uncharacterized protein B0H18DRAFT_1006114 [Neoantrodia serialis]KAH9926439.1 hypothetical protein B0H18DRAFT_1006114 [Neoantrodia serialis]
MATARTRHIPPRSLSLPVGPLPMSPPSASSSMSGSSLSPTSPSSIAKKSSLLHLSYHSHAPSSSAASTSSGSTSKSFGTSLLEAYHEWKEADDALQRLQLEERDRDECSAELAAAKKLVEGLKTEQDAARSPGKRKVTRKSSTIAFWKHKNAPHVPFQDVPAPDSNLEDLAEASVREAGLERESHRRTTKVRPAVEATKALAATLDGCYDKLRRMLDGGPLPSWRFTEGNEQAIIRAEKTVTAREQSYEDCVATTEVLKRARLAVQSAHHHYTEAMNLLDSVCSPSRNGFMAALGDEQSKAQTYREAAVWSQKAHLCLQSCLEALKPHMELLDHEQIVAAEQLKEVGLLQGVRLYDLMYGGKALAFGITQQVGIMVGKLDAIYRLLTNFAVAVQNFTENCQSVQEAARHSRDVARRELVALWMSDSSHAYSAGRHRNGTV